MQEMMQQIVQQVVQRTGISEAHARQAVEVVISQLQSRLPAPIAQQLQGAIGGAPGAAGGQGGAGGLGDLAKGLGGLMGGQR